MPSRVGYFFLGIEWDLGFGFWFDLDDESVKRKEKKRGLGEEVREGKNE